MKIQQKYGNVYRISNKHQPIKHTAVIAKSILYSRDYFALTLAFVIFSRNCEIFDYFPEHIANSLCDRMKYRAYRGNMNNVRCQHLTQLSFAAFVHQETRREPNTQIIDTAVLALTINSIKANLFYAYFKKYAFFRTLLFCFVDLLFIWSFSFVSITLNVSYLLFHAAILCCFPLVWLIAMVTHICLISFHR